ncbi:hypothetical protein M569_14925, partial [Genlisea aurea]
KGTVTPWSSVFPAGEAEKASEKVRESIAERQQMLDQLRGFLDDNVNLINLVRRLPDETQHHIMVPFGKAAFFPGRLIHTNELMVLLGEGYYAERSAKQTVEILKRRSKVLKSQVQSIHAVMQDLQAEADFFNAMAFESSEGVVEIREEYVEDDEPSSRASATAPVVKFTLLLEATVGRNTPTDDEEYRRIFSELAKLEKEEDEDEEEEEEEEEEEQEGEEADEPGNGVDLESSIDRLSIDRRFTSSQ